MASKLIVIEGLDGSGKGTQSALITQILKDRGHKVKKLTFPDYESNGILPHLVQTNFYTGGLTEKHVQQCIDQLRGKKNDL